MCGGRRAVLRPVLPAQLHRGVLPGAAGRWRASPSVVLMRVRIRVRILTLKYVRCRRTRPRGRRTRPSSWRRPPRLTATPTCVSFRPQRPTPALFHRAVSHSFRSSVALFDVRDARSSAPPSTTTKLCVATGSRTRGWCGAHPATPAPGPLFRLSERSTRCCASVFQQRNVAGVRAFSRL